jgi:hypothetical protein
MKTLIFTIIFIVCLLNSTFAIDITIYENVIKGVAKDIPYPEEFTTTIQVVCRNGNELILIRTSQGLKIKRVYNVDNFTPVECQED